MDKKYKPVGSKAKDLPNGELNPGLPRDRRGYLPLYYRGFVKAPECFQKALRAFYVHLQKMGCRITPLQFAMSYSQLSFKTFGLKPDYIRYYLNLAIFLTIQPISIFFLFAWLDRISWSVKSQAQRGITIRGPLDCQNSQAGLCLGQIGSIMIRR